MKILTILGARPQFIKAAPVSQALKNAGFQEFLLHTGQHYDSRMSDIFFNELGIRTPDINLHIHGGNHGQQTGRMIEAIEEVLVKEKTDRVLVYGDTNSTLAGALAAAKLHIPVDHIEAGLRSFNKKMPEEINRILTDHVSSLLFTPTQIATKNLKSEGVKDAAIKEVGDVMYDAVLHFKPMSEERKDTVLSTLGLKDRPYILSTIHRAENTDSPSNLRAIFEAFDLNSRDIPIVLPLHPRTREKIHGLNLNTENIHFIDPVGYLDMMVLTQNASLILTDSGGLQKEAYFLKTPCITLRDQTEWIELIESSWNHLVPVTDSLPQKLKEKCAQLLNMDFSEQPPLYGDGKASEKIAHHIKSL